LHPSHLDLKGLTALWREALLAQQVLLGNTTGYRAHPQLARFQKHRHPVVAISAFLWAVFDEATARGYHFDATRITRPRSRVTITVTQGQLAFERSHLRRKLRLRDRAALRRLNAAPLRPHPLFRVIDGDIEPWEIT
jgi:hypothetical protein